ncbi:MAG: GNAT family N-acetyltransferase [Acidobacteriota bacterium]
MADTHSTDVRIEILRDGNQERLEDFVRPHIDSSLFLLNNSRRVGLIDSGQLFEGTYYAAVADDRIVGVIAQYWQGNLVLQAPGCVAALMTEIKASAPRRIGGLLGPADQVAEAKRLLGWGEGDVQLDDVEGLYALPLAELNVPEALSSGRLSGRRMQPADLDQVAEWRRDYHLEALGAEDSPELLEQCRADMDASQKRGDTWVLDDGGKLVASTSFNAAIAEAVQVGGVWTPPALRSRGYGSAVVAVSLLDARDEGVDRAILFTGDDNKAARASYAKLGFARIGDYRVVLRAS